MGQQASKICSWKKFLYCYLVRNGSFEKGGVNSKKSGSACTSLALSNVGQTCGQWLELLRGGAACVLFVPPSVPGLMPAYKTNQVPPRDRPDRPSLRHQ